MRGVSAACASCGNVNPDVARFCSACGVRLREVASPRLERKFATALFADIVGSTSLAEREDPEVVRSLIARAFDALATVIERHGGTLEAYIGDAILAVFGIPVAHEDDAARAIRAGLEMQAEVARLNEHLAQEGRPALRMRVGIDAGEVLTDLERVAGPRDRMLTGDAVNTAARLQSAAPPGGVLVGRAVLDATRGSFSFRELEPLSLKGKAEPVPAWLALGERARPTSRGLSARLIGRDEELALLRSTFDRVRARGRPALVTIVGTAGVGKSRLAAEFVRSVEAWEGARVVRGRCRPYGNVSYSAFADAVKELCAIRDDDPADAVRRKTADAVLANGGDARIASALEALVAAAPSGIGREQLFDAWRTFLEHVARVDPLVLVLEDIHWADEGLLDLVEHVAAWTEAPLLVLALARPDLLGERAAWGAGTPDHATIALDPLTREETKAMIGDLLPAPLPEPLLEAVVERCEGNPLFGEELIRSLIDRGALRAGDRGWEAGGDPDGLELPRSIHAVIASRIDTLTGEEKALVQDAAVVGREFWLGAVERLGQADRGSVLATVARLRDKDILLPRPSAAFAGEEGFAFRHGLIRDVAYESLPKSSRADKHVAVARWAEERAGERREEIAELLATHYSRALTYRHELGDRSTELEREAYRWTRAAGGRALGLWQSREAARWFRAAVETADGLELAAQERARLWESYASAAEGVEPYATIADGFERALAIYRSLGRDADAGRVEAWLAHVAFQFGDDEGVVRWVRSALEHLEPLGESRDLALALVRLGWHHHRQRRDDEAEPLLRRAAEIAQRVGEGVVHARAMISLGMLMYRTERSEEGLEHLERGLDLARSSGDLPLLLWGLLVVSEALEVVASDYPRAEALVREGVELARRSGHTEQIAWMQGNLADYLVDMGRLDEAEEPAREGLRAAREIGEVPRIGYSLLMNAYLQVLRLDVEGAETLLGELRSTLDRTAESYHEGWADLIDALILRAQGKEAAALSVLVDGARGAAGRLEPWAGQLLLLECVRALVRAGWREEARAFRPELARLATVGAAASAFLAWADGLLESDPAVALGTLSDAAEALRRFGRTVDHARCLIDVAEARRRLGKDPAPTLAEARALLDRSGAALFLRDLEAAERDAPPPV
jgi:class 3 adenylate cyclase/tetratricopeptide (TPR) repeat protein